MGIQGLLPLLKSIMAPIHVEELRGQAVAVDAYSWLHKGAFCCATQLCKGLPTSKHIEYCMHRVNLLRHHGVKPILVFDGGNLPTKIVQETKRSRARKENLARAMEHEAMGNSSAAFDCYQKAVDISPAIALELIQVLKLEKVDYIVAPYEADAQMTFLSINKLVDAVITEDSDLIPFGCSRIIFKMDKFGHGVEFQDSKLRKNKDLDLTGFTKQMMLEMCILSGCDYLPSLPGMGLKRAHALVKRLKSYENVIKHLKYSAVSIPSSFEEMFKKAIWAFQHQRVYDPAKEDLVHLLEPPQCPFEDLDFLGPWLSQDLAKGIAKGDIDPMTKMPFQVNSVENTSMLNGSYPVQQSVSSSEKRRLELPVQKNLLTNYFCLASVEARRKFRAPKVMQKDLVTPDSSSPSSGTCSSGPPASAKDATCYMSSTQSTPVDQDDKDGSGPEDHVTEPAMETMEDKFLNPIQKQDVNRLTVHGGFTGPQMSSSRCKPFLTSHKEKTSHQATSVVDETRVPTNRKVIVRSSYFKHKPSDINTLHRPNDGATDGNENNDCIPGGYPVKKRKLSEDENQPPILVMNQENLPSKNARTSVHHGEDNQVSRLNNNGAMVREGGKFGCDISHVNNYTSVAERSMDRFAALMSSFRYTQSSARASGLRAPLKDVQNSSSSARRKAVPIAIEEFSYASQK
ncbi:exonuclease 1-like isoform X1 [Zingiber officinale]|uniref:exonuclease 1-like isoform X1 n=1 Tax=Zingiber officinale TaxID=94328 RepID=UPI001C4D502E|nr:exonuclease 1-like isoform X1 [Zingiber officinale]